MSNLKSEVKGLVNEAIGFIKSWWAYKRMGLRMQYAIRLADVKQRAYNKQYHIMLVGRTLTSLTRDEFHILQRVGRFDRKLKWATVKERMVFYSTELNRNNTQSKEERKKAVAKYMEYAKGGGFLERGVLAGRRKG